MYQFRVLAIAKLYSLIKWRSQNCIACVSNIFFSSLKWGECFSFIPIFTNYYFFDSDIIYFFHIWSPDPRQALAYMFYFFQEVYEKKLLSQWCARSRILYNVYELDSEANLYQEYEIFMIKIIRWLRAAGNKIKTSLIRQ